MRIFSDLIAWFQRKRQASLFPEREIVVKLDATGITSTYPRGEVQTIAWSEVQRVLIETNDSGPWGADVWWILEGEAKRCTYPMGATGEQEALAEYQRRFPGFDDVAVIEAMGSTSNARFTCWEPSYAHRVGEGAAPSPSVGARGLRRTKNNECAAPSLGARSPLTVVESGSMLEES